MGEAVFFKGAESRYLHFRMPPTDWLIRLP